MTDPPYVLRLRTVVALATPQLTAIDERDSARHPAPGKWSPRQVMGHLIDSAANNHQRFVRGQWQDDLVFPTYEQERWVEVQAYQDAPWLETVALWASYNRQLARVMAAVPESVRTRRHARHNFHQIAFHLVPAHEPATLDYLMSDYGAHLEHHLRQVLGVDWVKESELHERPSTR